MKGGGSGAKLAGIVYEPKLTLDLPKAETVGTSLNALAHAAEALYVKGRNDEGDREALAGAALISEWLPKVVEDRHDLGGPTGLFSRARCTGAQRSQQPASASATRWRRHSAAATAFRTAR